MHGRKLPRKGDYTMTKKINRKIILPVNGNPVTLEYQEKGYYLGEIRIGVQEVLFHIEAIPVTVNEQKIIRNGQYSGTNTIVSAKNPDYQNRIDNWLEKNECFTPQLVEDGGTQKGGPYFINIEPYAA